MLKRKYKDLFDVVSDVLFKYDPIGINFGTNTDEYDPEVGTILPRLSECDSIEDVRRITHEEFVVWFGADGAGPEENYAEAAEEIWLAWAGRSGKLGL